MLYGRWCGSQYDDGWMLSATEQVALLMARITRHRPGLLLLWRRGGLIGLAFRESGGVNNSTGKGTSLVFASFSRIEARNARIASVRMKKLSTYMGSGNGIEAHHDPAPLRRL